MRVTVRFRQRRQAIGRAAPQRLSPSAVMVVPAELKKPGALALNETVQWSSLGRALSAARHRGTRHRTTFSDLWRAWTVTGVGCEGSDLVVHVR